MHRDSMTSTWDAGAWRRNLNGLHLDTHHESMNEPLSTRCLKEMLSMARTAQGKRNIREKASVRQCLIVGCECAAAKGKRGLCDYHKGVFDKMSAKCKAGKERKKFNDEQVAAGLILESNRGRRPKEEPQFKRVV